MSGQRNTVSFRKSQQRFAERYTDMLWDDPENAGKVGPGTAFPNKRALTNFLLEVNPNQPWLGEICGVMERGTLITGRTLNVPAGFSYNEVRREVACQTVTPPPLPDQPMPPPEPEQPAPPPPPPPPPERTLNEVNPNYYQRQDSASQDGTNWRPGTQMHALELLARSGEFPEFTRNWYAPKNVAARHPVLGQRDTGFDGGAVLGHETGSHLTQGTSPLGIGEDSESRRNDGNARRRGTTGRNGLIGQAATGPRQSGFIPGHIADITNDGTMVRAKDMPLQFAHGGNYAQQISIGGFTINVRLPIPDFMPVGALGTSPRSQTVLNAETQRYGISTANPLHSAVNEAGYHSAFRDQQAMHGTPLESPDRIYAMMFGAQAQRVRNESLVAFDRADDPVMRQELATRALVAHRDLSNNMLIRQVDAMALPMQRDAEGIRHYLASQGVDMAAVDAAVAAAPRLAATDMSREMLESLPNYGRLHDSRYASIDPSQSNPAYRAAERFAFRTMNHVEASLARADIAQVSPAELLDINHQAARALSSTPGANVAFARAIEENPNLAVQVTNLLGDMPRNPTAYGFRNSREALQFTRSITGENGAARAEVERRGDTAMLPFIGRDQAFSGANPQEVAPVVAAQIRQSPAFFEDLLERATRPELGTDRRGRTDGRLYGVGIFSALSADMSAGENGTMTASYANLVTSLGGTESPAAQAFDRAVHQSALTRANGMSNVSVQGTQFLDNQYTAAQFGRRAAQGEQVGVIGGSDTDDDRARLRAQEGTGNITAYNTGRHEGSGAFDAARRGDTAGLFSALLRSTDARETNAVGAAVSGLHAYPALARDAVLLTILNEPAALNNVIGSIRSLDRSTRGDRYGELAAALEDTARHAARYRETGNPRDMERAVQRYGSFFANLEASQGHRHGALRQSAWDQFVVNLGKDDQASTWVTETVARDPDLTNGMLRAIPGILYGADGLRPGHNGMASGDRNTPTTQAGEDVYTSRYFQLATDERGRVKGTGLFSHRRGAISVNSTELNAALTGSALEAARGLATGGVVTTDMDRAVNNNPVIYIGTRGNVSPVDALASYMQQQGVALPQGVPSFQQLAINSIDQGHVTIAQSPNQLAVTVTTASLDSTIDRAGGLPAVAGISAWWLAALIKKSKDKPEEDPDTPTEEPPGCPDGCPPEPPAPPTPGEPPPPPTPIDPPPPTTTPIDPTPTPIDPTPPPPPPPPTPIDPTPTPIDPPPPPPPPPTPIDPTPTPIDPGLPPSPDMPPGSDCPWCGDEGVPPPPTVPTVPKPPGTTPKR